jgi:nicotinate-nucleotide adenylyltransferase
MRTGILGGSFDPVHYGHLGIARAVADALSLDEVLLMPASQAPLRNDGVRASGSQRSDMLQLAVEELVLAGEHRLRVSEVELRRGGLSYTAETLRSLRQERPADTLMWIVGADQFARLDQWREPGELARLAEWAVYARPGYAWSEAARPQLAGLRVHPVEPVAGQWALSSSAIRQSIAKGENLNGAMPDKVIEYIRENGLYRV